MSDRTDTIAIFPGTFDPITFGHLDIIDRGRRMFTPSPRADIQDGHQGGWTESLQVRDGKYP